MTVRTGDTLPTLARLVVKDGLCLGGLPPPQLELLLALVWASMPVGVMSEREVNDVLIRQLAGPATCLDTDHVELRRWLVDAGWLGRDGFGREYLRTARPAMLPDRAAMADELQHVDMWQWVDGVRHDYQERREARRRAWQLSREAH